MKNLTNIILKPIVDDEVVQDSDRHIFLAIRTAEKRGGPYMRTSTPGEETGYTADSMQRLVDAFELEPVEAQKFRWAVEACENEEELESVVREVIPHFWKAEDH